MNDKSAEVKASSPIRTSLYKREGSMGGSLKRPSLRRDCHFELAERSALPLGLSKKSIEALFPWTFKAICKRMGIPVPLCLRPENINKPIDAIPELVNGPSMVELSRSDDSNLCHEMLTTFGFTEEQMHRAAERFHLGCSKSGQTIYWMIDDMGRCLDGRLGDTWVSNLLKHRYPSAAPYLKVDRCFFGLHQITEYDIRENQADPLMGRAYLSERATGGAVASSPKGRSWRGDASLVPFLRAEEMNSLKPIGIVESERSAVLLSELCPELLWMAYSYGTNCLIDNFEPLQGRKITLYPRTDPSQEYYLSFLELSDQVKRAYKNIDISVSRFLEDNATDAQKQRNIDLLEFMLEK